jgi:maltose O-acetyltransferase
MSEMKERMLRGEPYRFDETLKGEHARALELVRRYNATLDDDLLRRLLGHIGEDVVVRAPFYCDYGTQISIGSRTFVNFDCVMLDGATITIGEACQLAPRVQLLTATHPLEPQPRRDGWESAHPISIGDNVWLGGGAIVCPGVTIGDDTVVGAGAVVTTDLPAGVLAVGVPARVQREIAT